MIAVQPNTAVRVLNVVFIYLWMRVIAIQCVSTVLLSRVPIPSKQKHTSPCMEGYSCGRGR